MVTAAQILEVRGRLGHVAHLSGAAMRQEVRALLAALSSGEVATLAQLARAVVMETTVSRQRR